jgi:NADH-quinone oxidoreductase subunit G
VAVVETPQISLAINGRQVTVAKGLSLVEVAAEAGIEVPVFCYEPRLGPAVGACRMCLVEIEGMPKLQTACTTPAADGMVVNSHSPRAREGQDAVLEFLLLNHPLDCPVCDKGGECPLQDLTFRYGPGVTRMTLPKRTLEKPIPVSPLIKLDRERCILCYRCTRFSEDVSGDMQLVAENRGANTVITTFEGRPYANEFSGNVTELCPVGALTQTPYRFQARPWEIQNVPTVCGFCPVGCNTYATIRAGQVARVLSRNHPEIDGGWLCDKGRFVYPHLRSPARVTTTLIRGGRGLDPVALADGLDHVAERLRSTVKKFGPGSVAVLASGEGTNEEAWAWTQIVDALGDGPTTCGPEGAAGWELLAPYAARIADLDDAETIVVVGDFDLAHRAPIVELRVRKAAREGARVLTVGAGATRLETLTGAVHVDAAPGTAHAALLAALGDGDATPLGAALAGRAVIVWSGRMSRPLAAALAHVAHTAGARVLPTPLAANELGCQAAGLGTVTPEELLRQAEEGAVRSFVLLGVDPVTDWPGGERWRAVLQRAFFALQATMFQNASTGWSTTIVPAASPLESEGTLTNMEGRVQRLRAAGRPPEGAVDGLVWASELALRLDVDVPDDPPVAFARLAASAPAFAGLVWSRIGDQSRLSEDRPWPEQAPPAPVLGGGEPAAGTVVVGYRQLMAGPAVDEVPALQFQRRSAIEVAAADADRLGVATGDAVTVSFDGTSVSGPAVVQRRLRAGVVRAPAAATFVREGELREGGGA